MCPACRDEEHLCDDCQDVAQQNAEEEHARLIRAESLLRDLAERTLAEDTGIVPYPDPCSVPDDYAPF